MFIRGRKITRTEGDSIPNTKQNHTINFFVIVILENPCLETDLGGIVKYYHIVKQINHNVTFLVITFFFLSKKVVKSQSIGK